MAYVVHINPHAPLGNIAALQALFSEDTGDEGIQGTVARTLKIDPSDGVEGRRNATSSDVAGDGKDR